MVMTFTALLKWMGGRAPTSQHLEASFARHPECTFVRGQVSGAVVPGLDLCKVNA